MIIFDLDDQGPDMNGDSTAVRIEFQGRRILPLRYPTVAAQEPRSGRYFPVVAEASTCPPPWAVLAALGAQKSRFQGGKFPSDTRTRRSNEQQHLLFPRFPPLSTAHSDLPRPIPPVPCTLFTRFRGPSRLRHSSAQLPRLSPSHAAQLLFLYDSLIPISYSSRVPSSKPSKPSCSHLRSNCVS